MPEDIESETKPHLSGLLFTVESTRVTKKRERGTLNREQGKKKNVTLWV
jgi:hypothetical protein